MKITISAPRGRQKALNMTRNSYVFVPGARKVLKSPKISILMKFHQNCYIVIKMVILPRGTGDSQFYQGTLNSGLKSIRGVAKPEGVFHDAARKVVNDIKFTFP